MPKSKIDHMNNVKIRVSELSSVERDILRQALDEDIQERASAEVQALYGNLSNAVVELDKCVNALLAAKRKFPQFPIGFFIHCEYDSNSSFALPGAENGLSLLDMIDIADSEEFSIGVEIGPPPPDEEDEDSSETDEDYEDDEYCDSYCKPDLNF